MMARTDWFGPRAMFFLRISGTTGVWALGLVAMNTVPAEGQATPRDSTDHIVALVLESNPDLVAARAAANFADARYDASGFGPPAALTAEMEEAPEFELGSAKYRLGLEREFMTGDRSGARRAVADVTRDRARLRVEWLERAVAAHAAREIAHALGWAGIRRRIAAEDSLLSMAEASLRDRLALGTARYLDVLRVGTERLRIRSDLAAAAAGTSAASASLLALAGQADRSRLAGLLDSLVSRGVEPPPPPPVPQVDSIVERTLAVGLSMVAIRRAQAERRLTAAEGRPSVSAGIAAELIERDGGRTIGPGLGLTLSLPFTAGRSNRLAMAAADAGVTAAEAAHEATAVRVGGEITTALIRYRTARERLSIFNESLLQSVALERETALDAYQNGELSLLELLDFERAAAQAAIERLRASMAAASAYAELWMGDPANGGDSDVM